MDEKNIKKIIYKYNLGNFMEMELLKSNQNKVYKVVTNKGNYVIKEYSIDAIGSYSYLKKREEQIRISEILNENGIDTVIPMVYKKRYFIFYKKNYYLIINFLRGILPHFCT